MVNCDWNSLLQTIFQTASRKEGRTRHNLSLESVGDTPNTTLEENFMSQSIPLPDPSVQSTTSVPIEIDVTAVQAWQQSEENWVLVDCREENEYETAKIEGAILLPMSRWQEAIPKLETFAGKHVVVHCHHGGRSLRVANWLRENGYPTAQSMAGGIDQWSLQIDPSIARY
jgi:rhodanese-related sulfurtransferase